MNKLVISAVPTALTQVMWPHVEEHIARVVEVSHGELDLPGIKESLVMGKSLLVTISDGPEVVAANILEVRTMDTGLKLLYIPITGGGRLDEWMGDFLIIAKKIAKDYNCTRLRGLAVRKGWMRVLKQHDWNVVHEVIECEVE